MLKQRLYLFKPVFWSLDFLLSVLATYAAAAFYFYVLAPHKRMTVVPDLDSWFGLTSFFPEDWRLATYTYFGILFALSQVFVFVRIDIYRLDYRSDIIREFLAIVRGTVLNLLFVLALIFFYRGASFSRSVILLLPFFSSLFILGGHRLLWGFIGKFYQSKQRLIRVFILGTGKTARELCHAMERHRSFGYRLIGVLGPKIPRNNYLFPFYKGGISLFPRVLKKYTASLVFYAAKHDLAMLEKVIRLCDAEGIDYRVVPDLTDLLSTHSRLEDMAGIPLLIIRDTPLQNGYNQFLKRIFDISFASIALVLSLPLLLLISLMIKLNSQDKGRGPVFFHQERVGLDRKVFWVWKFRTMFSQDKRVSDTTWSKASDMCVTKIGSFLRKSSLDELPQLWNVLIGNMSVVGPRPERPFFVKKFKKHYSQYMRRHIVKSGITGWAQIQGLRGDTSISKRIEADIYYIENWSFWLDMLILLKTLPAMLKNPGA